MEICQFAGPNKVTAIVVSFFQKAPIKKSKKDKIVRMKFVPVDILSYHRFYGSAICDRNLLNNKLQKCYGDLIFSVVI